MTDQLINVKLNINMVNFLSSIGPLKPTTCSAIPKAMEISSFAKTLNLNTNIKPPPTALQSRQDQCHRIAPILTAFPLWDLKPGLRVLLQPRKLVH